MAPNAAKEVLSARSSIPLSVKSSAPNSLAQISEHSDGEEKPKVRYANSRLVNFYKNHDIKAY